MGRLTRRAPATDRGGPGGREPPDHIFAYGSLVDELAGGATVTLLNGFRRVWGVAADNAHALPGYKRYLLRSDRSAPAIFVVFLDLVEDPERSVNGVLAPVTADDLRAIDRRERNYDRVDVTSAIESPPPGRVWTYVGSAEGRARLQAGLADGTAAIQRGYLEQVHAAFRALGADHYADFLASSSPDGLPVLDLERVDLPPAEPGP